jgi:3-deoxy-D-manno-octulosonic-acid transferase
MWAEVRHSAVKGVCAVCILGGLREAALWRASSMILILYNLGLLLALVMTAPWWLWQMAATRKYREGLRERLGWVPERITRSLLDEPDGRAVIWIHAVSVGEVLAVSRLVAELDAQLPEYRVMISTTTRTGQALARQRFGAARVFYCPLDLYWAVAAYLNKLRPALLVLAETEFWPNLLTGCFRRGIPVAVVNARISDRSWPRYWRLRTLWRPWLSRITAALAQTETDAERLQALGCRQARVGGNLKFDVRVNGETDAARMLGKLAIGLRIVVAGSTVDGEEAMLLEAWRQLTAAEPALALVLAPRHPERFEAVAGLLQRSGFAWRRRSEMKAGMGEGPLAPAEVVLLDTIGELAGVYAAASVAFVGGSLVAAGGHNPLEPAQFGVPVLMGEHYANFRGMVDVMLAEEALAIATPADLGGVLLGLLRDRKFAETMGERGRQVFEKQAGATERTVAEISKILGAARHG